MGDDELGEIGGVLAVFQAQLLICCLWISHKLTRQQEKG